MKKCLVWILAVCMVGMLCACSAEVLHIRVENPAKLMVEKEGGTMAITLTDNTTVQRITDLIAQIPLEKAEATEDIWSYRIQWQDENGAKITELYIHGTQIAWEGQRYKLGLGVDLSKLTQALDEMLETIPFKK